MVVWRPGGPGFESRYGNFASERWQFRGGDTKSRRSLYLVLMPGEVKDPTSLHHGKCVNFSWTPPLLGKANSINNPGPVVMCRTL